MNEGLSTKDAKNLAKASALSHSDDPKDQDRARARKTEVDYKDLVRQLKSKRKKNMKEDWKPEIEHSKLGDAVKKKREKKRKEAESILPPHLKLDAMKKAFAHTNEQNELAGKWKIDSSAHKKVQKKAKLRNLAKGNTNPNEKAAAEKKAGGPKLYGEEDNYSQAKKELKATKKARDERHNAIHSGTNTAKNTDVNEGKTFDQWKKAAAKALGRKEKERKAEKAQDAGAKARRMLKRREHAKYVSGSEDNVPDEMRD